jgi:hypothetical protein
MPVRVALPEGATHEGRRFGTFPLIALANVWMALMMKTSSVILEGNIALIQGTGPKHRLSCGPDDEDKFGYLSKRSLGKPSFYQHSSSIRTVSKSKTLN